MQNRRRGLSRRHRATLNESGAVNMDERMAAWRADG